MVFVFYVDSDGGVEDGILGVHHWSWGDYDDNDYNIVCNKHILDAYYVYWTSWVRYDHEHEVSLH